MTKLNLPPLAKSLSAKLLLLTIAFVMLAEVLIFAPSVGRFRLTEGAQAQAGESPIQLASSHGCNPCNPCAAAKCNPCNPCAAAKCNPCNPCAAAKCNPCNPCAAAKCNPCNPCAATTN